MKQFNAVSTIVLILKSFVENCDKSLKKCEMLLSTIGRYHASSACRELKREIRVIKVELKMMKEIAFAVEVASRNALCKNWGKHFNGDPYPWKEIERNLNVIEVTFGMRRKVFKKRKNP